MLFEIATYIVYFQLNNITNSEKVVSVRVHVRSSQPVQLKSHKGLLGVGPGEYGSSGSDRSGKVSLESDSWLVVYVFIDRL